MAYTVKKGDTLSGIYGSDWKNLSGYTGDPTKLQVGQQLPDVKSNVISAATMAPVAPMQIAPPTPDTTDYNGITGGITDAIINEYKTINQQQIDKQKAQETAGTDITKLMDSLTNKTADTQIANETAGVNTETANLNKYAQQLADLNAQASSLNREAQAIPLITQENNRNTGATDAGVAPQTAGALRLNALKALSIGQQADIASAATTGSQLRLQAAKDKAQQIVDLKYKPIEDALAIKEKQYELNKDVLMSIDKKRAESLALAIDKEKTALADAKEKEKEKRLTQIADTKTIQDMMINATQIAPKSVLDSAKTIAENGGTPSEVAMALGKYGGDYYKNELLKQQIETEKAQKANYYANIAKTNAEVKNLGSNGGNLSVDEKKTQKASIALVELLDKYKAAIKGVNFLEANMPAKRTEINGLKGRITAEYKQAKQLGTLDAGVQKLIDSIIPDPGNFSLSSFDNAAQVKAIEDFRNSFVQTDLPVNAFSQAIGQTAPIQGTSIIKDVSNGNINFNIPTK